MNIDLSACKDYTQGKQARMFVYSLIEPISEVIRYVGATEDYKKRYKSHINNVKSSKALRGWITKLKRSGQLPKMVILERHHTKDKAYQSEGKMIRRLSPQLFNSIIPKEFCLCGRPLTGSRHTYCGFGCNKGTKRKPLTVTQILKQGNQEELKRQDRLGCVTIKTNLSYMIARLEIEQRKKVYMKDLAIHFDTSISQVKKMLFSHVEQIDMRTCEKVLEFFHDHGLYYALTDLFSVERLGEEKIDMWEELVTSKRIKEEEQ